MTSDSEGDGNGRDKPGLFAATRWSVVLRARDKSEVALNSLCQNYRQPLIVWLRGRGYSPHDAEDIVHGLFQKLLNRDFLKNVAKEKGRFRTFMKSCLMNYLRDQHAKKSAERRGSGQPTESLDATFDGEDKIHDPADPSATPDVAFDRAWVSSLLANALRRLHEECARQGREVLYRELEPVLSQDETASGYREIGIRLGMSEAAVKMAASRLRARLKGLIQDEIKQTVSNETEWRSEAQYLMQLFGR
jgi:RNA polymerase sigma-70 factor (ECF subfamily)